MSFFTDRLKERRKLKKYSQEKLAQKLGISKSAVSMYETGEREPPIKILKKISEILETDISYFTNEFAPAAADFGAANLFPLPPGASIPLCGNIACGSPIYAEENIEGYVTAPRDIGADFCLRCKGDSMTGARIYDGDLVLVKKQSEVENGEIAVVLIDNEATLKRVYKNPHGLILQAENPRYAPIVITGDELSQVRIQGKAVAIIAPVS